MKKNALFGVSILTLLFGLVFWVTPTKNSQNNHFDVAVLIPGTVEFFAVQKKGLNLAAKSYGINLIYADAEWDAGKQLSQVENFIARKVDLILLCSVDNLAMQRAVTLVKDSGIPLMTFSNTIGTHPKGKYPGVEAHIGRDEVKSGEMLGKMVEKLFTEGPVKIVLVQGAPGTSAQRMRQEGFLKISDRHPDWEIISNNSIPGWSKEGALNAVEDFLQTGKHANVIVTQWWSAAIAAAMALREKSNKQIEVISLEFSKEIKPYIQSGEVDITTYFSIAEEGFKAVETAGLFLEKKKFLKFVEIEPTWVDRRNVNYFKPEL